MTWTLNDGRIKTALISVQVKLYSILTIVHWYYSTNIKIKSAKSVETSHFYFFICLTT